MNGWVKSKCVIYSNPYLKFSLNMQIRAFSYGNVKRWNESLKQHQLHNKTVDIR